ncbi:MAG: helicase-related protein [Geminicoccaceae bacterium]
MLSDPSDRGRVVAVLGPTNTGKTHLAVERMLAHRSGMMGFPLRLLAREIYDRILALRGPDAVALVTGEEKVGPENARYTVCTVEAMPVERPVAFLAVDEIQLCADLERGHIFTDRLLNARGTEETMFLGAETIRPVLKRLVPQAEVITRPRYSLLTYAGDAKLNRLPRRSAVVAFTAADVYQLAEVVRRQKGGAAVVLGALSPRTRNAQVGMYQAGEVDHLVATDAIGMGLNMDVAHVAFASLEKFDGRQHRRLASAEIAQIAGRAGRHMSNGTFGGTNGCAPFEDKELEAVENHAFPPVKVLRWRNDRLDFSSVDALSASLDAPPPVDCLVKVRDALDDRSLAFLSRRDDIRAVADRAERIRLLWQVCQIPDFRKTLTDAHLHLLAKVFGYLTSGPGRLPNDWLGGMIARLERTDGDIDTLVTRIAHIRTMTYLSHRRTWLNDPLHWQERAREVEDRLSDALHDRLTQRFVDRRTSALVRSLRENGEHAAQVDANGEVVVDDHVVGRIDGLVFSLERREGDPDAKALAAAARRAAMPSLLRAVAKLAKAEDADLSLDDENRVLWQGKPVARLRPGASVLEPRIEPVLDAGLDERAAATVRRRIGAWLEKQLGAPLLPLRKLQAAAADPTLGPRVRGLAFRLVEALGSLETRAAHDLLAHADANERRVLTGYGVRFGVHHLYVPALLRAAPIEARARLWQIAHGRPGTRPTSGQTVWRPVPPDLDPAAALAVGFALAQGIAIRLDILERLAARLRSAAREADPFTVSTQLGAEAGLSRAELVAVIGALGYAPTGSAEVLAFRRRQRPAPTRRGVEERKRQAVRGRPESPFALLAQLKVGA